MNLAELLIPVLAGGTIRQTTPVQSGGPPGMALMQGGGGGGDASEGFSSLGQGLLDYLSEDEVAEEPGMDYDTGWVFDPATDMPPLPEPVNPSGTSTAWGGRPIVPPHPFQGGGAGGMPQNAPWSFNPATDMPPPPAGPMPSATNPATGGMIQPSMPGGGGLDMSPIQPGLRDPEYLANLDPRTLALLAMNGLA